MPEIQPGQAVIARTASDREIEKRAVTGVVMGHDFPVVWLSRPEEWEAAERDGRKPDAVPWPAEDVRSPLDRFTDLTRRIVAVPKADVDAAREAEQRAKGRRPQSKA